MRALILVWLLATLAMALAKKSRALPDTSEFIKVAAVSGEAQGRARPPFDLDPPGALAAGGGETAGAHSVNFGTSAGCGSHCCIPGCTQANRTAAFEQWAGHFGRRYKTDTVRQQCARIWCRLHVLIF